MHRSLLFPFFARSNSVLGVLFFLLYVEKADGKQNEDADHNCDLACGTNAAHHVFTGFVHRIRSARKAEVVGDGSAGDHAEHGNCAVAVALARKDELTERAAAEEHAAPADEEHAEDVPKVSAVGDGLAFKAELELALNEVADENQHENGNKTVEELEILEHEGVTQTAYHAETRTLCKGADHKSDGESSDNGRMHGTGAGFAALKRVGTAMARMKRPVRTAGRMPPSALPRV